MSTGIGNHNIVDGTGENIYSEPLAHCPYCDSHCDADWCDVGIGLVQSGPFYCQSCGSSEISSLDKRELTEKEKKTGWYEPATAASETANTINGSLVGHKEALILYKAGLLDEKGAE